MKLPLRDALSYLDAVRRAVGKVEPSAADPTFVLRLERLATLLSESQNAELSLEAIHEKLFSHANAASRRSLFSSFRTQLTDTAKETGYDFALIKPEIRGAKPADIRCYFEGRPFPRTLDEATRRSVEIIESGPDLAAPRMVPGVIRIFVSFANKDRNEVTELVDLLKKTWGPNRSHKIDFWMFHDTSNGGLAAGEPNEPNIRKAMARSPLGLLLLSPDYTASEFIKRVELPEYLGQAEAGKHPIPVNLRNSAPGAPHLPEELRTRFIFTHEQQSYEDCKDRGCKERFAIALNQQIETICQRHFGTSVEANDVGTQRREQLANRLRHLVPEEGDDCKKAAPNISKEGSQEGILAVEDLLAWAKDEDRAHYFALLGEVGAGKTTTALMFVRRLNAEGGSIKACYFDLRYVNHDGLLDRTQKRPLLAEIMSAILRRQDASSSKDTPADYLEALRNEGLVLVFDGLDEVLVSLDQPQQDAFMQQLLSALPLAAARTSGAGKLLLACRTHFFRSSIAEKGAFTIHGREGLDEQAASDKLSRRTSFETARMLPFTEDQIRTYFTANLPDVPFEKVWSLLEQVHNLRELATRPYLLNLIRKQLPKLQQALEDGRSVHAVDLYANFLEDWSTQRNRDHNLMLPVDKLKLMALLAAHLWRSETKTLAAAELEQWLIRTIASDPVWRAQYGDYIKPAHVEELLGDLRTATFVARWDGDLFRFAHTSIQEYFLAHYLEQALLVSDDSTWDLPMVSMETLDFLGELLKKRNSAPLNMMNRLLGASCLNAACIAFAYWMRAIQKGYPEPNPQHVCLAGAKPDNWAPLGSELMVIGHGPNRKLNLRGANLEGVDLRNATIKWVDLNQANLRNLIARQTILDHVSAIGADMRGADFGGSNGRALDIDEFPSGKPPLGTRWRTISDTFLPVPEETLRLQLQLGHSGVVLSSVLSANGRKMISGSCDFNLKLWDTLTGECLRTFSGHSNWVRSCAMSRDSLWMLSGSDDNTLRLWDTLTGECLRIFTGHSGSVLSCAVSADGMRLLSGSDDCTLKLWDTDTGECLRTFSGHSNWVRSCAMNADGKRLLSGSDDSTLRLWDADTGECLRTFSGHSGIIWSCAMSEDGKRLLSGSGDSTLKLWNVDTRECLRTFSGHSGMVWSCAMSEDGKRLLSGSDDHTLRLWDADTGECLRAFSGHNGSVLSCAVSANGKRALSSSLDASLRIWDIATNDCLRIFSGHVGSVLTCAMSADGTRLISGSDDCAIKHWDAVTGNYLCAFVGHSQAVLTCALSADGKRALSGSLDGTLKLWDTVTGECLDTRDENDPEFSHWLEDWSTRSPRFVHGGEGLHVLSEANGERIWSHYDLPNGEFIRIDERLQRPIAISPGAWPYVRWRTADGTLLHAETFGPLESLCVPQPALPWLKK